MIDGLTGVQRVLFGWAQVQGDESPCSRGDQAPGPPTRTRRRSSAATGGNIDEFYEAFGVTEDDALYLDPRQRVRIWS